MTLTYSSANEVFFLAFIYKSSTILISLSDYDTSSHAGLQQWVPYHLFLFQLTLYPFQPLYPSSDYFTNQFQNRHHWMESHKGFGYDLGFCQHYAASIARDTN